MDYETYAPLWNFQWNGDDFQIAHDLAITRNQGPEKLAGLLRSLADEDWAGARESRHWLRFKWADGDQLGASEILSLVSLAMWVINPSRTQVRSSFHLGDNRETVTRHLDRLQFIPGKHFVDFSDAHLQELVSLYPKLRQIYLTQGRLSAALMLTLTGCHSIHWSTAIICHASAAEGLLTYEEGSGITKRLSKTFACLTQPDKATRDGAFAFFKTLYKARSDIMHGRTHNIPPEQRLTLLDQWQDALRTLWSTLASSQHLVAVLEDTDDIRRQHFQALQAGYHAPQ